MTPGPLSIDSPSTDVSGSDSRWELVERVLAGAAFQRSPHSKAFLVLVCERALGPRSSASRRGERSAADRDALDGQASGQVRAQASQVRKKLQQHFTTDGAREPLVIDLALGSYEPIFRAREIGAREPRDVVWLGRKGVMGAAVVVALLLAATAFVVRHASRPPAVSPERPFVDRLWRQMFANEYPTSVLLADAKLTELQDRLGMPIALADYVRDRLDARIEQQIPDAGARWPARRLLDRRLTTMADTTLAGRVLLLHAAHHLSAEILLARDATPGHFDGRNVIVSGPRRANPWLDLFEPQLNFQSRFDEQTRLASFENTAPRSDEQAVYSVQWANRGFCRVAYLPGRDGRGTVLLVSGTDLTSTEIGADFITSERWIRDLRRRLELEDDAPMPYFEVLLGSKVVVSSTSAPELIAVRVRTSSN